MILSCAVFMRQAIPVIDHNTGVPMNYRFLLVGAVVLFLSACGSTKVPEPIGIGSDTDELKKSPCACIELPQDFSDLIRS